NTQGFENGAGFRDQSRLYHLESDYDISRFTPNWNTIVGASYRLYDPESNGIIFPDTVGNDITMFEYSFFAQTQRELLNDKLQTTVSARVDKNENFQPRISPGLSVLYRLGQDQRVRFSVQSGFRFPSLKEQFAFQNLGRATLVGGLTGITDQLSLPGNSFFEPTVQEFNQVVDTESNLFAGTGTLTREQAELANLSILTDGILGEGAIAPIKPEKVLTLELGFRSYFLNRKIYFDINGYANYYTDFIGVKRVFKPRTSPQTDLFLAAGQLNRPNERDLYFINTNSTERVITNGVAAKVDYHPSSAYTIGLNATWSKISAGGDDAFIPSFNTPEWKGNASIARKFKKNIQAKATIRMRNDFQWQSNFGDGVVERFAILDIQVTKDIPSIHSHIKIGVSNALNSYYTDVFGGPQIGALPFIQLMYNPKK
ncbi:MAG: TonB-dependent receptor, partial [Bacteroidota bacterium]